LVTASGVGKDAIRATNLIRELSDAVEFSVALDLNTNEDKVVGSEVGSGATFVDTVAVSLTAIFDNQSNDLTSEVDVMASVFNVVENRGAGIGERCRRGMASGGEGEVEGKLEFTAHGGNAADDVGAVDGTAVPSVSGNHGGFDPDEMRATIRAGNGDGFVKVTKETLNTDGFVITTRGGMETNTEEFASSGENTAESAAGVDDDEAAHADFQQDLLKQKASKFVGMDVVNRHANHKLGEVTHGGEEMASTGFGNSSAWAPKVTVQNKHGSGDGPAEENFAVSTDALVGEDAMSAFLDPVDNILAATGPKEAHANAEQGFAHAKMTTDRAAMEHVEDETAQRRGHDDKQKGGAGLKTLAHNKAALVDAEVVVARELLEGRMKAGNGGGAPSGVRR
jgi:hypothetical protein